MRVAQRNLSRELVETERLEDVEHDVDHLHELLFELVRPAEDVGVVLREAAHARQSVQLAALFVAVNGAELGEAQRQILVRARFELVYFAVVRAVHRLEQELLALVGRVDRLERVLAVLGVVARRDIEVFHADVRRDDLQVAVSFLHIAQEVLQTVPQRGALGQPQRQSRADPRREAEQLQLLAQLAMVAFFGFLEHGQILVEHRLLRERDAVDTRQHLVLLVAAPVGSGYGSQLDRLDVSHVRQMGPPAQVGELSVGIETDRAVLEPLDQFYLILVAFLGVGLHRVGLAYFASRDGLLGPGQLLHFLFDFRQVALGDRGRGVHVVVESVLDARADAELDARVERFERFGHQVGRRVPECLLAFGVFPFVQLDLRVGDDGTVQVHDFAVDRGRQHFLSQTRADAFGDLHRRRPLGVLTNAAVGESHFNHSFET